MATEDKLDDAIDKANDFLEGCLEGACGWLLKQVDKAKERKESSHAQEDRPDNE